MSTFAIRPQLPGDPDSATYNALHQLMASMGFFQFADGTQLPHATYLGISPTTAIEVRIEVEESIRRELGLNSIVAVFQVTQMSVTESSEVDLAQLLTWVMGDNYHYLSKNTMTDFDVQDMFK